MARHLLSAVLSRVPATPVAVATGHEALEVARHRPDLAMAVVDLFLPDMLGLDLVEYLRGIRHCASMPVLMCSGSPDPDVVRRAAALGVRDFVKKPVQVTEFLARARAVLGR